MKSCNKVLGINTDFLEDKALFDYWYQQMPEYRKEKIDRYKPEASKRLSLGAGILIKKGLEEYGVDGSHILLGLNDKPYIESANSLEFNVSHSGSMAVCAFSDACVGIDIEGTKVFNRNLINFVYKQEEIKYIKYRSKNQNDENCLYTKLWTIKESIMKYYGKGLSMDPRKIFVDMEDGYKAYHDGKLLENIFFTQYECMGYHIAVCSEYERFSDEIGILMGE